jgi:nucleoside-diphosphate-sugar epimerase
MKKFLITGTKSGLGKFLFESIEDSHGLTRDNFNDIKSESFDVIVHCAFNKENSITDYAKYLNDNIVLTQELKKLKCKKFIYISSIDVYSENLSLYATFKKLSETMMDDDDIILRCSAMVGKSMKANSLSKIYENVESISLSGESTMNYILYNDLLRFIIYVDQYKGIIDFVANDFVTVESIKNLFNSKTRLGNYTYNSVMDFTNPIYKLNESFNKSSIQALREYYGI